MATTKQTLSARTSLTSSSLGTLASATYCASSAYNCATNEPQDVIVEVECATTNTPAGNKQLVVFISESLDGTNFRSGPTSGTTTTNEPNLRFLGTVPMNTASTTQRATFSVAAALGYCPDQFKIITKNDLGVALTSGALYTSEVIYTAA
jgi:hypothetical protein